METWRAGEQSGRQGEEQAPGSRDRAQRVGRVQSPIEAAEPAPILPNQVEGTARTDRAAEEGRPRVNRPQAGAIAAENRIERANPGAALSTGGAQEHFRQVANEQGSTYQGIASIIICSCFAALG